MPLASPAILRTNSAYPLAQLYTAEARPPGRRSSSCFSSEFNMVNVENGKQKAQEQTDEKSISGVWAMSRRASEVMPEEPTFRRHLA